MLHGDLYNMESRVKEEFPNHEIVYVGGGRYNVIEKRKQFRHEGVLDGRSLFSMVEVGDIVFSFAHIPDMRVLHKLREGDLWRHPRGPMGWYNDHERKVKELQQKRREKESEEVRYAAANVHQQLLNEMDGMSKTHFQGV